jgi:predicted cupin superfamily sugar epimerase
MHGGPLSADSIIAMLDMRRHPEGGWYAETFRDNPDGGRGYSTAIYFLLRAGEFSAWHRVDAAEAWHFYAGAALDLMMSHGGRETASFRLGVDLAAGERPQAVVPAGWWQMAKSTGEWTLAGCTVAPGFDFDGFELAPAGWAPGA